MSQVFSNIGGALKGVLGKLGGSGGMGTGVERAAGIGLGIPSLISQWQYANQQKQQINNLLNLQKQYQALTPSGVANDVTSMTRPLDNALVQGVGNQVQGQLAERGLAQAPGIYTTALAQALAPFFQQNQQTASQLWSNMKQLPFYVPQPNFPQQSGFKGILDMIQGINTPSLIDLIQIMKKGSVPPVGANPMPHPIGLPIFHTNSAPDMPPPDIGNSSGFDWQSLPMFAGAQ